MSMTIGTMSSSFTVGVCGGGGGGGGRIVECWELRCDWTNIDDRWRHRRMSPNAPRRNGTRCVATTGNGCVFAKLHKIPSQIDVLTGTCH